VAARRGRRVLVCSRGQPHIWPNDTTPGYQPGTADTASALIVFMLAICGTWKTGDYIWEFGQQALGARQMLRNGVRRGGLPPRPGEAGRDSARVRRRVGILWVRDTYTSRNTRRCRWKSGNVAEVFREEDFACGERFLKLGCGFQDIWKTRGYGRE
jgi:hypothetical protein